MNEAAAACLLALPAEAPRDAVWWVSLGAALQRCHRIDDAIAAYMQSLALKMDDATVHFRLGMCFKDKHGMKAEAAECARTALALGLAAASLLRARSWCFLERRGLLLSAAGEALATLRAAIARAPASTGLPETCPFRTRYS